MENIITKKSQKHRDEIIRTHTEKKLKIINKINKKTGHSCYMNGKYLIIQKLCAY